MNKDSYLILETLPAEYDSRVKAMEVCFHYIFVKDNVKENVSCLVYQQDKCDIIEHFSGR